MVTSEQEEDGMLPGTAREMIEQLIATNKLTEAFIARAIGVNRNTIKRIRRGDIPSSRTDLGIIRLYLTLTK